MDADTPSIDRPAAIAPAGPRRTLGSPSRGPALALAAALLAAPALAWAWDPVPVADDALAHMPGTQPAQGITLQSAGQCQSCHANYSPSIEPGFGWRGSMMGQAARDPLFWPAFAIAAQDSIYQFGRPNAADMCERCHFPGGWLEGHSDPVNASMMTGFDFDGVSCDACHRLYDPFFTDTASGAREGMDWVGYWDESNMSMLPSQPEADATLLMDQTDASALTRFNGQPLYDATMHIASAGYIENGNGQYYVSSSQAKRGPFADATPPHNTGYSRYHKSKFFCSTCHDVSNAPQANASFAGTLPGDMSTVLPTESGSAHGYFPVERTFSEFMLSSFGLPGGAPGDGPFAPGSFTTSHPGNAIASCQDCHMADMSGKGCDAGGAPNRPMDSVEHPQSGVPTHDLTGGNALIPFILASTVPGSPNFDQTNADLLNQGPAALTLDLAEGLGLSAYPLLAARNRALQQLSNAAALEALTYNPGTGAASFRIRNQTAHKLITGYAEGRRMFVNVKLYQGANLLREVNPYDPMAGTLRGLPLSYSPNSPPLAAGQDHMDDLVYEVHGESSLLGGGPSFHFLLTTGAYKDNRIPPKGFRINEAASRAAVPYFNGAADPNYFTAAEYAGGYDDIALTLPAGGNRLVVELYYQTTSREYIEFLRDEINGTATTLTLPVPSNEPNAYVIQTDPFFAALKAWGNTIWDLWMHNKDVPGAAPVLMTKATLALNTCGGQPDGTACDDGNACTMGDTCQGGACQSGATISCDDGNVCTDDSCDAQTGCVYAFNTGPCEEGNMCTGPDACASGLCVPGEEIFCFDGDPCTDDTCDPAVGCAFAPLCGSGGGGGMGGEGGMSAGGGGMGGGGEGGGTTSSSGGEGGSGGSGGDAGDDDGCGCSVPGSSSSDEGVWAIAAIAAAGLASRKRRRAR